MLPVKPKFAKVRVPKFLYFTYPIKWFLHIFHKEDRPIPTLKLITLFWVD